MSWQHGEYFPVDELRRICTALSHNLGRRHLIDGRISDFDFYEVTQTITIELMEARNPVQVHVTK